MLGFDGVCWLAGSLVGRLANWLVLGGGGFMILDAVGLYRD